MRLILSKRFARNLQGRFGKFDFEVGILKDKPYRNPKIGPDRLGTFAGGPISKASRQNSGKQLSDISKANRDRLGFNYLTEPFRRESSDIIKFTKEFFKLAFGRSQKKRAENLLQAIVRNPILRGEYGPQAPLTTALKGFNRPMIDTAQLFRNLKAMCKVRGR